MGLGECESGGERPHIRAESRFIRGPPVLGRVSTLWTVKKREGVGLFTFYRVWGLPVTVLTVGTEPRTVPGHSRGGTGQGSRGKRTGVGGTVVVQEEE